MTLTSPDRCPRQPVHNACSTASRVSRRWIGPRAAVPVGVVRDLASRDPGLHARPVPRCGHAGRCPRLGRGFAYSSVDVIACRRARPRWRLDLGATLGGVYTSFGAFRPRRGARDRAAVRAARVAVRARVGEVSRLGGSVGLFVVFAVLGGFSPFEPPVDLVGVRVPPLAHPVLEARFQHDRDRIRGRRGDRSRDLPTLTYPLDLDEMREMAAPGLGSLEQVAKAIEKLAKQQP